MPRRSRLLAESGIYHVMLRGVNRGAIFVDEPDFEKFLGVLAVVKYLSGCEVFAYCLMTNHVHLVLRTAGEPVGAVIKRLGVRYAGWFNRKYDRVGHLFQDRFKSLPVEDDAYLWTLLRYVWGNPVEAGLVARPEEYMWSSRPLLGSGGTLVDEVELRRLVPEDVLTQLADDPGDAARTDPVLITPLEKASDAEAARLLERASGARPEQFATLDRAARRRAVRLLRACAIPNRQIARVTGVSEATIRRLQQTPGTGDAEGTVPAASVRGR